MSTVRAWNRIKSTARKLFYIPVARRYFTRVPILRNIYPPRYWERPHPIDSFYGIATGGVVFVEQIHSNPTLRRLIEYYEGSQPSVVRRALKTLGNIEGYVCADMGCGKGRATVIASEFPFEEVIGVELSPQLAEIARANAAEIARRFPDRPLIRVVEANAVDFLLPHGRLVLFMYNPFGAELMAQLLERLETSLASGVAHMFIVYYNPVLQELFDSSSAFTRWRTQAIPCVPSERSFTSRGVVNVTIWQSVRGARPTPEDQWR